MCNNLAHPLWGAVGTKMNRLRPAQYGDFLGAPRGKLASTNGQCVTGGVDGQECFSDGERRLPNARYDEPHYTWYEF